MNKKKVFLIVLIAFIVSFVVGYKMYNEEQLDLKNEKTNFKLSPKELIEEFSKNDSLAHKKYNTKKIIELTLKPDSYSFNQIDSITYSFNIDGNDKFSLGATITKNKLSGKQIKTDKEIIIKTIYSGFIPYDSDFEVPGSIKCKQSIILN